MAGIAGYTDAARSMKVKGVRAAKLAAVLFNPSSYMSLLIASPLSHLAFDFSKVYSNGEFAPHASHSILRAIGRSGGIVGFDCLDRLFRETHRPSGRMQFLSKLQDTAWC
jgi:hypothetical protein